MYICVLPGLVLAGHWSCVCDVSTCSTAWSDELTSIGSTAALSGHKSASSADRLAIITLEMSRSLWISSLGGRLRSSRSNSKSSAGSLAVEYHTVKYYNALKNSNHFIKQSFRSLAVNKYHTNILFL